MFASAKLGSRLAATGIGCAMLLGSVQAALSVNCKPSHFRPPFFIKSMGACAFDPETLSFAGTAVEQAMCLTRGMDATRNLAPPLDKLPAALAGRVGETAGLPSREALSSLLSKQDLEWDFAAYLWQPVSHARDNDPEAPSARYFVIHDTSGPNYRHRSFPDDIDDEGAGFNKLANFACADGWGKAHVVVNRAGEMLLDHDFAVPWRETKFEQAADFGGALKGLFLHVELIQPRRAGVHGGDARSPDPAFSPAQYDRLALLYAIASVRAQRWLIPAFHAALDAEIPNGHDDPLNFNIESFADSLDQLIEKLQYPEQIQASVGAPTTAARSREPAIPFGVTAIDDPPAPAETGSIRAATGEELNSALAGPYRDAASKPTRPTAPPGAMVATKQGESLGEQKTANAERCTTRIVKGHRRRLCEPDLAANGERENPAVRAVDRRVSRQSHGARHHGSDLHPRHARNTSRHGRA